MKKIFIILFSLALILIAWFAFRKPKIAPSVVPQPTHVQTTNTQTLVKIVPESSPADTNAFVRPDYIDEDHWNELMKVRRLILEQNQPIEFYARVMDQYGQPIEGAKLAALLGRVDEKMFETTNFFHHQMGDEVLNIRLELHSDSNGWIQVTGTNGSFLELWGLTKDGYLSSYPNGNFGGVHYEPHGVRTPMGDILMTNAWNPLAGYILHLQKIEETNSLNSR